MTTLERFRRDLQHRNELEQELADMRDQLDPLKKEFLFRKNVARQAQEDVDSLSHPGLKNLFLDLTGKKEAVLLQKKQEAAVARSEMDVASLRLETQKRAIAELEQTLCDLSACELLCLEPSTWDGRVSPPLADARRQIDAIQQLQILLPQLDQQHEALMKRMEQVTSLYLSGDIHTDIAGNRYNNRWHSMREHIVPCQAALTAFLTTLATYSQLAGWDLREVRPDSAIEDPAYLTAYSVDAKELYDRFENVSHWLKRLSYARTAQNAQRLDADRQRRQTLRETLLKILPQE